MLNLKKAITRINIDLLRNERKILFLENLIEHLIQNEHNVSIIMDKSVHLDKYIDEKVNNKNFRCIFRVFQLKFYEIQ